MPALLAKRPTSVTSLNVVLRAEGEGGPSAVLSWTFKRKNTWRPVLGRILGRFGEKMGKRLRLYKWFSIYVFLHIETNRNRYNLQFLFAFLVRASSMSLWVNHSENYLISVYLSWAYDLHISFFSSLTEFSFGNVIFDPPTFELFCNFFRYLDLH